MNSHPCTSTPSLLDWVDFKWLMAAEGCRVDVNRLQVDPAYAQQCVTKALQSPSGLLRRLAERLQRR